MFSIYDKRVGAYMPMFPARARGEAIRLVQDAATDPQGQFVKHLVDYDLYEIGTWDDGTGEFNQSADHPIRLVPLADFRQVD